jgi:hypothetical protein
MARISLVLACCAVLVAGGWWLQGREAKSREREASMLRRLSTLEQQAGRSEPTLRIVEVHKESGAPPVAASSPPPEASNTPTDAAEPPRSYSQEELALAYANEFDSEPVDPAWGPAANNRLGGLINDHLPKGSSVLGFECRSRFCRLDVVHDNVDKANQMLMDLFFMERNGPLSGTDQGFRTTDPVQTPDGKQRFTVFISRPGVPIALDSNG